MAWTSEQTTDYQQAQYKAQMAILKKVAELTPKATGQGSELNPQPRDRARRTPEGRLKS